MNEYEIVFTNQFKKDFKMAQKRGCDIESLKEIIEKLSKGEKLPENNHDHPLYGNYKGCRECHIKPDWLLVYQIFDDELVLYLIRTGSHSDLF